MLAVTLVAVAMFGQAGASTMSLPQCSCMEAWPGSDNASVWAATWGSWGVPSTTKGCFHDPTYNMAFCPPNTSAGACLGEGSFDTSISQGYMACGTWEQNGSSYKINISAATPELTAAQKISAFSFMKSLRDTMVPKPMCKCSEDWSSGKVAKLYCGANAAKAKGPVNRSTCVNTPALIASGTLKDTNTSLPGTWCSTGMKTTGGVLKYLDGSSVPDSASCDIQDGAIADCADGEILISYPNVRPGSGPVDPALLMMTARTVARSSSPRGVNGGYSMLAFPPNSIANKPIAWGDYFKAQLASCSADSTCSALMASAISELKALQANAAAVLKSQQDAAKAAYEKACNASVEAKTQCENKTAIEEAAKKKLIEGQDKACSEAGTAAKCKQTWNRARSAAQAAAKGADGKCGEVTAATKKACDADETCRTVKTSSDSAIVQSIWPAVVLIASSLMNVLRG